MQPEFITFTGLDANTDLARLASLSGRYPIEWGVLFSRNRQGLDNRYPSHEVIDRILDFKQRGGLHLSAHLCGKYAQDIMLGTFQYSDLPLGGFDRIQVNHVAPNAATLRKMAIHGQPVIAQWRDPDSFPSEYQGIDWLYDPSGGRGMAPSKWPDNVGDCLVGYAGGINAENIRAVNDIVKEKSKRYWLDMESGIRVDDVLNLDLVEKICASIFRS